MRKSKVFLNLLMFIGVGVTLLHFFSTPVLADSATGNWHYSEVVDTWEEVGYKQYGTGDSQYYVINYAGYSHGEITITTDSENAFGSVSIYGYSYPYSGLVTYHKTASTKTSWQVRTNTYDPGSGTPSSIPPFNLTNTRGSFTATIIDKHTSEKLVFNNVPGSYDFKYSSDLSNWVDPWGASHKDGYYKLGSFTFTTSDNDSSIFQAIFRLDLPIANTENIPCPEFYKLSDNGSIYPISINYSWVSYGRFDTVIYFVINDTYTLQPLYTDTIIIKYPVDSGWCYPVPIHFTYLPYDDEQYIPLYEFIQNQGQNNTTIDMDNKNDSFSSASGQMIQLEDQLQGDFNSAIGNITVPDNPFGNMGQMFGNSSRFLVHMFDQMTISNGSPFGTVITFSLILGLALLMIGKKGSR